jgi:hypothetical protein
MWDTANRPRFGFVAAIADLAESLLTSYNAEVTLPAEAR